MATNNRTTATPKTDTTNDTHVSRGSQTPKSRGKYETTRLSQNNDSSSKKPSTSMIRPPVNSPMPPDAIAQWKRHMHASNSKLSKEDSWKQSSSIASITTDSKMDPVSESFSTMGDQGDQYFVPRGKPS